jgi:hypothetical protein
LLRALKIKYPGRKLVHEVESFGAYAQMFTVGIPIAGLLMYGAENEYRWLSRG